MGSRLRIICILGLLGWCLQAGVWQGAILAEESVPLLPEAATNAADAAPATDATVPTRNLFNILSDGGPLMLPIFVCSFVLLVFCFERAVMLRRSRVIPGPFVRRVLQQIRDGQLDRDQAIELCKENPSPTSGVFVAALKKWGRPAVEVEQAIIDAGERMSNGLRKYLRVFNGIYTIGPMLGLMGTVLGMILSFNSIAQTKGDDKMAMLAEGIGHALLTTLGGIAVAVPALCLYMYFTGRVDKLVMEVDALGQQLVELIAADRVVPERPTKPKAPRREAAA
jgi:biopolymer transport protein ExbB